LAGLQVFKEINETNGGNGISKKVVDIIFQSFSLQNEEDKEQD
jgi:hypothetical protein